MERSDVKLLVLLVLTFPLTSPASAAIPLAGSAGGDRARGMRVRWPMTSCMGYRLPVAATGPHLVHHYYLTYRQWDKATWKKRRAEKAQQQKQRHRQWHRYICESVSVC